MTSEDFDNMTKEEMDSFIKAMEYHYAPQIVERSWPLRDFLLKYERVAFSYRHYCPTEDFEEDLEPVIKLYAQNDHATVIYNLSNYYEECIIKDISDFTVERRKSGHYVLYYEQTDEQVMKGTIALGNGDLYTGSLKNDEPYGWGKYKYANGNSHNGFFDILPNGIGYHNMDYHMEIGNYRNGLLTGWGIRYLHKKFQFGFWENGELITDETDNTLWIRKIISAERATYNGNLVQIDKNHNFIRFGIPEKGINIGGNLPNPPKFPSFGFMFFKDGSVKVGEIKNENSGLYIQYNTDGTTNAGHWENGIIDYAEDFFKFQKNRRYYEIDGFDVYESVITDKNTDIVTINKEQSSDNIPANNNSAVASYSQEGKKLVSVVGENIKSFDIPEGTKTLEEFAFSRCKGLTKIKIPRSVTTIQQHAFAGCKELESVTLYSAITNLSVGTFSGCENLSSIILPHGIVSIEDEAFKGCKHLKKIVLPSSITAIGKNVFDGCDNLQSIFIPTGTLGDFSNILKDYLELVKEYNSSKDEDVRSLDKMLNGKMDEYGVLYSSDWYVLYFNTQALESYIVKNGTIGISSGAFQPSDWQNNSETTLKGLELPNNVIAIGGAAFANNKELNYINIPKDAFFICEDNPFAGCDKLRTIKWDCIRFVKDGTLVYDKDHTTLFSCLCPHYKNWVMKGWPLLSFAKTHGRMQVGFLVDKETGSLCRRCLFTNSEGVKTYVSFGVNLENISIKEIVASKNTLFVVQMESGEYLLHKRQQVMIEQDKVIVLQDGLKSIAANAFYNNTTLEDIYLPKSLRYIGENAFYGCSSLKRIGVPYGEIERFSKMLPKLKEIIDEDLPF